VRDCIIRNNHATFRGGGLLAYNVTATLENLLIYGNDSSDKAGGMYFEWMNADSEMINCTVVDNEANFGASCLMLSSTTDLTIESCILAYNTGAAPFSLVVNSELPLGCNLIFGNDESNALPFRSVDLGGNFELDPLFCDRENYLVDVGSPCLPGQHPDGNECGTIGARGSGCGF
jgi:hypothetical protein